MARRILIYGSGGHAKVAASVARAMGLEIVAFVDHYAPDTKTDLHGVPIVTQVPDPRLPRFIAVGNNRIRLTIAENEPGTFITLVHPSAIVDPRSEIAEGALVCAGAILQPDTRIGAHAIINTAASVDHDSEVGDFAHLCPGSRLAGDVKVGKGALIGTGASIIPSIRIGEWARVGAGSAVIRNVAPEETVAGVPARPLNPT